MPPKKQKPSEKERASKKAQSSSDKTFGLKNKNRSSKVQKYVQQVEAQSATALQKKKEAEKARKLAEKKAAEQARAEAAALFNPVLSPQKIPFGVDPKTVLCIYFKQGLCDKGKKCKFSHDLTIERKVQKKDLYTDDRENKLQDTMDKWDEKKLRDVILSKHGNPKTTTDIVCKYFIQAVENGKYGWFWSCPNGNDCKYKHSLPPGFVLKTKEEKRAEKLAAQNANTLTLEDFLEVERHKLGSNLTPVTLETFQKWKTEREEKKKKAKEEERKKGKFVSGRQLFESGNFLINEGEDDDEDGEEWDFSELRKQTEDISNQIEE